MVRLSAGEKKKRLIVSVCKKLFYRNGYVGTTYDDICQEADIPPGTITYHFGGKAGIATAIEVEYEAQNKQYIEKMCGDLFTKTQLAVVENFHMWKRIYEDDNIRRFLCEITSERIPSKSVHDVVEYYYRCVMDDQEVSRIGQNELDLIVAAQLGLSDALVSRVSIEQEKFSYEEVAHFATRFFLRQIGMSDEKIEACIADGKAIFDRLPIDNRYYVDFQYDERYVTKVSGV